MAQERINTMYQRYQVLVEEQYSVGGTQGALQLILQIMVLVLEESLKPGATIRNPINNNVFNQFNLLVNKVSLEDIGGEDINKEWESFLKNYLQTEVVPSILGAGTCEADSLILREFGGAWQRHKLFTNWLVRLLRELDKPIINLKKEPNLLSVTSKTLFLFFKEVFQKIQSKVVEVTLNIIDQERQGLFSTSNHDIKKCCEMIEIMGFMDPAMSGNKKFPDLATALNRNVQLDLYQKSLEAPYLVATRSFYEQFCVDVLTTTTYTDVPKYLKDVQAAVVAEEKRIDDYMNKCTKPKVQVACLDVMVVQRQDVILPEIFNIFKNHYDFEKVVKEGAPERTDTVCCLYRLVASTRQSNKEDPNFDLIRHLAEAFRRYVEDQCANVEKIRNIRSTELTEKKEKDTSDSEFIDNCMKLFDAMYSLVDMAFDVDKHLGSDKQLGLALDRTCKEALESFMNEGNGTNTQRISTYIDSQMTQKDGVSKDTTDGVVKDEIIRKWCRMFMHIIDKDLFLEFYHQDLCKRLLGSKGVLDKMSLDLDFEREVLNAFILLSISDVNLKLQNILVMLNDIKPKDSDQNLESAFQEYKLENNLAVEFKPLILTYGKWPLTTIRKSEGRARLPEEIRHCVNFMDKWYKSQHDTRKIDFIFSQGTVHVRATLFDKNKRPPTKKTYTITCATYQAVVLCLFDRQMEGMSVQQIGDSTNLSMDDSRRVVHSLLRFKLLRKSGEERKKDEKIKVANTDVVEVNDKYTNKSLKFSIDLPQPVDFKVVKATIDDDRRYIIQACIVRTMKARKRMAHQDLLMEVTKQVSCFQVSAQQVKNQIGALMEQEYLERDKTENNVYNYLA